MKNQINLKEHAEKTKMSARLGKVKGDSESPTIDFLTSIKNKLGNIEKEERSIEEDFDDLCSGISRETINIED